MKVTVTRGAGENPAPESIVDELCQTQSVCVQRGRNYLDDQQFNKKFYSISMPYRQWLSVGDLCEVVDEDISPVFKSKVTSCEINFTFSESEGLISEQNIRLERSIT